jgi:gliding motility-associated-like protein
MVFNPVDTGLFYTQSQTINGCDTAFTDSIIHQRLGVQINYNINNPGTATFAINGVVQAMPYAQNYWAGETISIAANVQPNWLFSKWRTYSNSVLPNANSITATFVANASDSCVLVTDFLQAFISGNDTICDNINKSAEVKIYFSGATPPFTFVYAINGVSQPSITTTINPYVIYTNEEGIYTLTSFANGLGLISGSALVTIYQAPVAKFHPNPDTLTILYTTTTMIDESVANTSLVSWYWSFGDGIGISTDTNPTYTYEQIYSEINRYQVDLIVVDAKGCSDSTSRIILVTDDYWMYIPNSFTPDLDGKNDNFCISYRGIREETFTFNLYSRFSELVYSTNNINDLKCIYSDEHGWDGRHYKTGNDLPMGTYIYEVSYQEVPPASWKHQDRGHLFIIR